MANGLWLMVSPHSPPHTYHVFCAYPCVFAAAHRPTFSSAFTSILIFPQNANFLLRLWWFQNHFRYVFVLFSFPYFFYFSVFECDLECVCVCVAAAANRTRSVQPRSAHVTEPNGARQTHVNVAAAAHGGRAFFAFSKIAGNRAFLQFSKLSILNKRCGNVVDKNYGIT